MRSPLLVPLPLALLLLSSVPLASQTPAQPDTSTAGRRVARTVRLSGPAPVIDGVIDDAAWQAAPPITGFTQRAPNPGAAATLPSEARVLYDDGAVYVAMRMHDPHADSMQAPLGRRDLAGISSEWAHVMIDSYNDKRTAFRFSVNPRGVQKDAFHSNDTSEDLGWDAVWQSAARVDSAGWSVEYRIPLSQLRYSGGAGERTWGLQVTREIARRNEVADWSPVRPDRNGFVSQFGELAGISGLRSARRLEVLPYSVARLTREPGDGEDPFWSRNQGFGSVGGDLKYGLTSDLTLTATINPDFGQVEADPSQVNLSAFETFFSERRPFFVEGSDIFSFDVGFPYFVRSTGFGSDRPFYSRRLGRAPQAGAPGDADFADAPEATTILGAVKVSGKTAGGLSIGVLDALTAREEVRFVDGGGARQTLTGEPLTNYAVVRTIQDFRGGQSAIGAIVSATHRDLGGEEHLSFLPTSAYLAGLDGRHRFGGGNYALSGSVLGTHVRGGEEAIAEIQTRAGHYFHRPDADHLEFDPTRTSLSGWLARAELEKVGGGHWRWGLYGHARSPGLEMNDLGYQRSTDWMLTGARIGFVQFKPGKLFRQWDAGIHQWNGWSFGGERLTTGFNAGAFGLLHNNWGGWISSDNEIEAWRADVLRGGPAFLAPSYTNVNAGFFTDGRKRVSGELYSGFFNEWGTTGGGWWLGGHVAFRPNPRMRLTVGPNYNASQDPWIYVDQQEALGERHYIFSNIVQRSVSISTRLDYAFTPKLTLEFYAQPFVAAGEYSRFKRVADPRADDFADQFHTFTDDEIDFVDGEYLVDLDADDDTDLRFGPPDFNFKEMRTNMVLRWEYRPGSTVFLVWSQGRSHVVGDGSFDVSRDFRSLFDGDRAPPTNVLLLKVNYWLNL
ncbi:MAG TPA: DUF5916 domain-containing protein [Longimicrobium sp.]|nr:DUF5916 domain-containing protein [Longimicrobium sp.]